MAVRFGGVIALEDVSFAVEPGERFAIIGPNGAGKTTLFNVLTGFARPDRGTAAVDGHPITGRSVAAVARLGVVRTFQELGLFERMDVLDNVLAGCFLDQRTGVVRGMTWWGAARAEDRAARRRCDEILDRLGLDVHRHAQIASLPYGVRKRVELARALARRPRVLLLDEPAAGLGDADKEHLAGLILSLQRELGFTLLVVDHDMPFVMALAERVLVLDFGRVIALGAPDEVREQEAVVDAYLGKERRG